MAHRPPCAGGFEDRSIQGRSGTLDVEAPGRVFLRSGELGSSVKGGQTLPPWFSWPPSCVPSTSLKMANGHLQKGACIPSTSLKVAKKNKGGWPWPPSTQK